MRQSLYYAENSIPAVFRNRAAVNREKTFLRHHPKDAWIDISWSEVREKADAAAAWLIDSGIVEGDKIAIYSENRPEWIYADQAVLAAGCADVTIYATNSADEAAFILNDSDARFCFCGGALQVDNLLALKHKMPGLEKIIVFDNLEYDNPMVVRFLDVIDAGRRNPREEEIDRRIRNIDPETVMTIMYTSGTTGYPKGVMLSHRNMTAQIINFVRHQPHPDKEIALSVLPLAHALERSIIYHLMLYIEGIIAFSKSPSFLIDELKQVRPTALLCVPRIPEKIYEGIMRRVKDAGPVKRALFRRAEKTGRRAVPYLAAGRRLPPSLMRSYAMADRLVFAKIRRTLGLDRLTTAGVGGAALPAHVHEFFIAMRVDWLTGYGLTETSPVTHTHTHKRYFPIKIGTAGLPLPLTECRIADDGEILIRGPQVMMGYYKRPKETAEAFTADGWFRTGDIGGIDEDGYLTITDRKKDILITSCGKNVAPQPIEAMMSQDPFIDQIMLVGENRKYISALIIPEFEALKEYARNKKIECSSHSKLIKNPNIIAFYGDRIERLIHSLAQYKRIKRFRLLSQAFTHESGHATPTMKIKRRIIEKAFKEQIESMYD